MKTKQSDIVGELKQLQQEYKEEQARLAKQVKEDEEKLLAKVRIKIAVQLNAAIELVSAVPAEYREELLYGVRKMVKKLSISEGENSGNVGNAGNEVKPSGKASEEDIVNFIGANKVSGQEIKNHFNISDAILSQRLTPLKKKKVLGSDRNPKGRGKVWFKI
jgi:hypothetical protein